MKLNKEKIKRILKILVPLIILICSFVYRFEQILDIIPYQLKNITALALVALRIICIVIIVRSFYNTAHDDKQAQSFGMWEGDEKKLPPATKIKLSSIKKMLEDSEIIEFVVSADEGIIKLGTSTETEPGRGDFFNKEYYAGDKIAADIDEIFDYLDELFPDGEVEVFLIDGLQPKHYNIPH